ncbi:NAD(P)H-dependent oxidoreductase [Sphingosinithalassobacter sp. CS137]|uniref:NAD(P)H-dependent oxidoreductase n=1 Tax=Sphingosinithalassobacter sp. CS137 TaxID=2762748 RepID=UPI00165EB78C|nr:NAD(P)H-dependent oxidoreductase [Sphingosinithalassobacter sp. CS137]
MSDPATRRIVVIDGHPDPDRARFVHALADAYAAGAADAGHAVRRIDIATMDFPLLRNAADWKDAAPVPDVVAAQEAIGWAEHLVILYPLWLGDVPALLKGFLEQVARPGFAIGEQEGHRGPVGLLKGRSARLVVTMGMPALFYRSYFGAHSVKSFERNILKLAGVRPVSHTLLGGVEDSAEQRAQWLDHLFDLGGRAE